MSATDIDDTDDRSGRILVLSTGDLPLASLEQLVHSVTGHSQQVRLSDVIHDDDGDDDDDEDGSSSFVTTRPAAPPSAAADGPSTSQIPWTIDNAYYTADVHFRLVPLPSSLSPSGSLRGAAAQAKRREREDKLQTLLKEETKDVTAIVLIVRGGQTLKEHEIVLAALQRSVAEQRISEGEAEDTSVSPSAALSSPQAETDKVAAEAEMPVGFGLAVSTVISLPSIVDAQSSRTSQGKPASRGALLDFYAQNGWEYIDLGAEFESGAPVTGMTSASTALLDDSTSEGSEDGGDDALSVSGSDDDGEADEEAGGLERVREALQANMWPGLVRKDRSASTSSHARAGNLPDPSASPSMSTSTLLQDRLAALSQVLDANGGLDQDEEELDAGLDAELDSLFRRLDLNLPSGSFLPPASSSTGLDLGLGGAPQAHAEPTAQDEELARRFLASIADFEKYQFAEQVGIGEKREGEAATFSHRIGAPEDNELGGTTLPESEEERNRNQAEALRKLEEWLQNEDEDWPGAAAGTRRGGVGFEDFDSDAPQADLQPKAHLPTRATGDAFDDDFDEFIGGGAATAGEGANAGPASFGFDEELSRHPHYKPAVDARSKSKGDGPSRGGEGGIDSDSDDDGERVAPSSFDWPAAERGTGAQQPAEELKDDAEDRSSSSQGPFHSFPPSVEFDERIE